MTFCVTESCTERRRRERLVSHAGSEPAYLHLCKSSARLLLGTSILLEISHNQEYSPAQPSPLMHMVGDPHARDWTRLLQVSADCRG